MKSVFVDLVKNKETYTAFDGLNVWQTIYKDNCMIDKLDSIDMSRTCTEKTLLFQIVSGLHTSINLHVATNFID